MKRLYELTKAELIEIIADKQEDINELKKRLLRINRTSQVFHLPKK